MKRKIALGILALCMAMPTAFAERDVLLETNPADAVVGTPDYVIETVRPQTKEAIHAFAAQWANARAKYAEAKQHEAEGTLTDTDKAWLKVEKENTWTYRDSHSYARLFDTHIIGRVHFYERSHNWNGQNEGDKEYNYMTYPGAHNQGEDKYVNSYGFNVLRTMADKMRASMYEAAQGDLQGQAFIDDVDNRLTSIIEDTQKTVQNDELRYYINQTVWYTTKQVKKERKHIEPDPKKYHVVDLAKAMKEPAKTQQDKYEN